MACAGAPSTAVFLCCGEHGDPRLHRSSHEAGLRRSCDSTVMRWVLVGQGCALRADPPYLD